VDLPKTPPFAIRARILTPLAAGGTRHEPDGLLVVDEAGRIVSVGAAAATPATELLYPPEGPQTVAQVLDSGFRVFKASLVRCLLFGAIAMIAGQLPPNTCFCASGA